jgi:hypothetical protein
MCADGSQLTMRCMNTTVLNYHLATVRTEDLERDARNRRIREARGKRPGSRDVRHTRRAALVARLIG